MAKRTFKPSMAIILPIAGNFMFAGRHFMDTSLGVRTQINRSTRDIVAMVTAFDYENGSWRVNDAMKFYGSLLLGVLVHKYLGKYVNPYLRGLPFNI